MHLTINHVTDYTYTQPVHYGLQQVRLSPISGPTQMIEDWTIDIDGGKIEVEYQDQHKNHVCLISVDEDATAIQINSSGTVQTNDTSGIIGPHTGAAPLWYFKRHTSLTKPGAGIENLINHLEPNDNTIARLHALSHLIGEGVTYRTEQTNSTTTAEQAIAAGQGVCQDHAHIFIAVSRQLGLPARYVSGYLMMNDRIDQDATHAWAEVYIDPVGWVGFDVSNAISPDARFVRIATGLDYLEAAPISGVIFSGGAETLLVTLQVQQ